MVHIYIYIYTYIDLCMYVCTYTHTHARLCGSWSTPTAQESVVITVPSSWPHTVRQDNSLIFTKSTPRTAIWERSEPRVLSFRLAAFPVSRPWARAFSFLARSEAWAGSCRGRLQFRAWCSYEFMKASLTGKLCGLVAR